MAWLAALHVAWQLIILSTIFSGVSDNFDFWGFIHGVHKDDFQVDLRFLEDVGCGTDAFKSESTPSADIRILNIFW